MIIQKSIRKAYKYRISYNISMLPSDSQESLDDCILNKSLSEEGDYYG
jgi:hypothetical protein